MNGLKKKFLMNYVDYYNARLPRAYQEVEYIESTGTQLIDTGVISQNTLEIKTKIKFGNKTGNNLSGADNGGYFGAINNIYYVANLSSAGNTGVASGNVDELHFSINDSSVTSNAKLTINGVTYTKNRAYTPGFRIYLFTINTNMAYGGPQTIYYYKIYNNDVLVRHMIPCYRKSDNRPGMYDIVNGVFYTNIGTGTFLVGDPVYYLPKNYQEVEYIESSGTQHIDTEYVVQTENVKMQGEFFTSVQNREMCIIGGVNHAIEIGYSSTVGRIVNFYSSRPTIYIENLTDIYDKKIILGAGSSGDNEFLIVNDRQSTGSKSFAYVGFKVKLLSYVSDAYEFRGRTYYFKLYDNDILAMHLIPCYRKSDGEIGMYDVVNDKFYTNSGTGVFTKGQDV